MNAGVQLNALDPNSFAELQRLARTEGQSNEALRAAAKQFEALFMQMLLKSMRDATPSNSLLDSDQTRMYQSMLDQQLALNLSQSRGTGLADALFRQLGGKDEGAGGADAALPGQGATGGNGGFDLAGAIRRPAISAVAGRAALAVSPDRAGDSPAGLDTGSVAGNALLEARFREALQHVRDAGGAVSDKVRGFVAELWPHAVEASKRTGIPPAFMVAQAALETGWGEKQLRHADGRPSHNLFNIKAGSAWSGRTVDRAVTEYADGRAYTEAARFRAYSSYAESFRDYAELMTRSPRYAGVLGQTDAGGFARGLQDAGYATDPQYADKLTRIIGGTTLRSALAGIG
ncbi:flagellar assembly peptidoglycan hydrolase FlgJ [Thauera linaloolentis]|uniref:Peptidoglycan hydrolase FlgJ n=1 Tax=Thauera linaloolentis (strain DSM 12138 / JCM 21573 / CCUG 41526 / CIP 105981 / IAM 15112 / NBRC 102519 / 47Lol) TaxID=1123367 RepID=N6ZBF5_THAL4|nr:flagellar assembly peptidoglycan hydrolase FlgJ [Thauera linaloolentis]ENO89529.1 flagellar rod assembly protein/muramidase FlgJ [Thauera linaloolentis 47Lol = DSM 12138]MCM8565424.1 flagellar assembly peptidoglycan hydrolase FlgJ [Thauera linaloolentis]